MSISQNFPAEGPTLNLNFAGSKKLDPRITFTRTSSATYMDDNGLIVTAPSNTPRFDHSYTGTNVESLGLLIEESRSNIALQSQSLNTSPNVAFQLTVSADATTAPDGTLTADKLVENTANSSRNIYQSVGTISGTYTVSCFLKAAERYRGYLQLYNNAGGNAVAFFDLNAGTITTSTGTTTITAYPNGWYRVTASANFPSDVATIYLQLQDNSGNSTYTGDGSSGLFAWGLQVEAGAFPTSYIPTTASTVTRSADNASMTGTNFSSWYNQTEGTLFTLATYNGTPIAATTNRTSALIGGGVGFMWQLWWENGNIGAFLGFNGSSYDVAMSGSTISINTSHKLISAYKTNDCAFSQNGGTVVTDTSATINTDKTTMVIGDFNSGNNLNGRISRITYYPTRLSNSQLQNLTK